MKAVPGFLALAFMVMSVQADTLQLRDGRVISGTFEGGDRAGIRFQPYGENQSSVFSLGSIQNITFEGNSAASSYNSSSYTTRTWNSNGYNGAVTSPLPEVTTPMPVATTPMPVSSINGAYTGPTFSSTNIQSPENRLIPAGTVIAVRTVEPIDCDASHVGTTWQVTLAAPIILNGQLVAPIGSPATVEVTGSRHGEISLQLVGFTNINGQSFNVASSDGVTASGTYGAQVTGGLPGTVNGYQIMRGRHIDIQPQTLLSFTLQQNVQV